MSLDLTQFDPEVFEYLQRGMSDSMFFNKMFFPEIFDAPWSSLHHKIFELIDSGEKKIAIAAPRGIGKTSIARGVAMKGILYRMFNFIVYIQNSATLAEMQTENIKMDLLSSKNVRETFGNIKIADMETYGVDDQFSKSAWIAYGNTLILPRGSGQQIRGLNWRNFRPQLIIVDDLEDADEVANPEIRDKQKDWFLKDVMKSVSRYRNDYVFIYIDTIKHEDSLLQMLMDSNEWSTVRLSICDENYKSLDPNYMTDEEILQEVEEHRAKEKMDVFYMEFMNLPISLEDAAFRPEYFKHHNENDLMERSGIENVILSDPAKTVKAHSAESAIICVGIDTSGSMLYIREVINKKMYPDEYFNELLDAATRHNAKVIAVEVTSLEEFIKQPIKNEMFRRGLWFDLLWVKSRGGKGSGKSGVDAKRKRAAALIPYYRQGLVSHNPTCCGQLEQNLLMYPKPKLWDIIDALAFIIEVMEMGDRYFEQTEDPQNVESEYDDIQYDDVEEGWRICP